MATKIRLQRQGRRKSPVYFIVVANSKTKRDGKVIEKLGRYEPLQTPAFIDLNIDSTLHWIELGAKLTDTVKNILSKKGVFLKKHLNEGVKKGILSESEAEKKLSSWLREKEKKIIERESIKETKKKSLKAINKEKENKSSANVVDAKPAEAKPQEAKNEKPAEAKTAEAKLQEAKNEKPVENKAADD